MDLNAITCYAPRRANVGRKVGVSPSAEATSRHRVRTLHGAGCSKPRAAGNPGTAGSPRNAQRSLKLTSVRGSTTCLETPSTRAVSSTTQSKDASSGPSHERDEALVGRDQPGIDQPSTFRIASTGSSGPRRPKLPDSKASRSATCVTQGQHSRFRKARTPSWWRFVWDMHRQR